MAIPNDNIWSPDMPSSPDCGTIEDTRPETACCQFDFPGCDDAVGNYAPGDMIRFNTYWSERWEGGAFQVDWTVGVKPNTSPRPIVLGSDLVDFGFVEPGDYTFCVTTVVEAPPVPSRLNPILGGFSVRTPSGAIPPTACASMNIN